MVWEAEICSCSDRMDGCSYLERSRGNTLYDYNSSFMTWSGFVTIIQITPSQYLAYGLGYRIGLEAH